MKSLLRLFLVAGLLATSACQKPPVKVPPQPKVEVVESTKDVEADSFEAEPTPIPTPTPVVETVPPPAPSATPFVKPEVLIVAPEGPSLTNAGRNLIYEFEVGGKSGYNPRPEAPDARISGITEGIGYDNHYNSPSVILQDWRGPLGETNAKRLAATHPYYGPSAQAHLKDVKDIYVSWAAASDIFDRIDVAREFASAKRLWPGFAELRPNAQAALISQGFNRGWSTIGANRTEMARMKALVPKKDYDGIAGQLRASIRVWRGTSVYNGLARRRNAEAKLVETP
jgi:hypothetical protein